MIKIKEEYLDTNISCPFTKQTVNCRFLPLELYDQYYNNGYSNIFEEETTEEETIETNDILITGDEHNNADPSGENN